MEAATGLDLTQPVDLIDLPERRVPLNFRVPESLKEQLHSVVDLWKIMARARGRDPKPIDMTHVCESLLKIGLDAVWAQVGQMAGLDGMPKSKDEWAALEKAIVKRVKEDAASRK